MAKKVFDVLIFEGMAVCLAEEFSREEPRRQYYMDVITGRTDGENEEILKKFEGQLDDSRYDYNKVFGWNEETPWAGYSLGYYLVKKYLERSGKNIERAFADRYGEIKNYKKFA